MSALGQKQTCAVQKEMSALPPKADMCSAQADVCFVPIADIRLSVQSPDRRLFRISRIKSVDEPATLKFIDER